MEEMELYSYDLHENCRIYIYKEGSEYSADIYWPSGVITEGILNTKPENLLDVCKDFIDMVKEDI